MKKRLRLLAVLLTGLQLTWLAACSAAGPAVSVSPSHSPGIPATPSSLISLTSPSSLPYLFPATPTSLTPFPSPAPDAPITVKTDYSQLTPYKPPEEVYTRLSPDYMPELVPSKDYGPLLPYVGQRLYSSNWGSFDFYGLMTKSGMMVTDAVYSNIYSAGDKDQVYILFRPEAFPDSSGNKKAERRYAISARDGSWVTPFDYVQVHCCDQVMLLVRNTDKNDLDVMDYSGRILYNTKTLESFHTLAPQSFYKPNSELGLPSCMSGSGIASVIADVRGNGFFLEELSGRIIYPDLERISGFDEGLAAVEEEGLWGYIDTNFNIVIKPQYKQANPFENGKAIVELSSGGYAVIDAKGHVLFKSSAYLSRSDEHFSIIDDKSQQTSIYNESFQEIYNSSGPDFRHFFTYDHVIGSYYIKNNSTTVCYRDSEVSIPGEFTEVRMMNGFIYCGNDTLGKYKVTTLDGKKSYDLNHQYYGVSSVQTDHGKSFMILNTTRGRASHSSYLVLDENCRNILNGVGFVTFDKAIDCFKIVSDNYFAYIGPSSRTVFRKSLLSSLPD